MLRVLLGSYLGAEPGAIEFGYGRQGKPELAGAGPRFNLAHSGGWVLVGVSGSGPVGVDVERVREMPDLEAVMERFFAPGEVRAIRSLPEAERKAAFFACWTRKEAYIKAVGAGLSLALDSFEVSVRPSDRPALLALDGSTAAAADWTLWSGAPAAGYAAAAAASGQEIRVVPRCWSAAAGITPWRTN
jgi:4'-phosphopantetheinyl transferase